MTTAARVLMLVLCAILLFASTDGVAQRGPRCHPSYRNFCIPPPPPDLDCGEIEECDIEVVGSDPHGFDRDHDGIGCECR